MYVYRSAIATPIGDLHYAVGEKGAIAITLPGQSIDELFHALHKRGLYASTSLPDFEHHLDIEEQIEEYFAGSLRQFSFAVDIVGTPFQIRAWQALRHIPYGQTRSYRDMAVDVGVPGGSRAIGQANNRNPLPLYFPCHRVVAANGGLGGFAGGLDCKRYLLDLEQRGLRSVEAT